MSLVPPSSRSTLTDSWLGSQLAAQLVNPTNTNGVWTHPPDILAGSDLALSSDGTTVTFLTTAQYVVVLYVYSVGTSPGALTVSPLVTSSPTNYYNIAPTAVLFPAFDAFSAQQVTYPPAKMSAGDTMVINFEVNGATITVFTATGLWVTRTA